MMQNIKKITAATLTSALVLSLGVVFFRPAGEADASSHREAPYISTDPQADATDLYAFVSPDKPDTVTLIANYIPMQVGPAGPNFYRFGDDVLYEINLDNNGDAQPDMSFQFKFWTETKTGDTFLYNTGAVTSLADPDLNVRQYYSVSMLKGGEHMAPQRRGTLVNGAEKLMVAPANVGPKSYPEGYTKVRAQAVYALDNGMKVFAGPSEDPFFVDLGGIFDVLSGISGKDYVSGLNVHTIAIQVPMKMLTADGMMAIDATNTNSIIGAWTTSYRKSTSVLRPLGQGVKMFNPSKKKGYWVQLSRLGNPLVNEVVIPLKDKNRWNASKPENDGQFLSYVTNPELASLMKAILGVNVPPTPRNDLVTIFLTGIPSLNQPKNVVASEGLRLNMAVKPASSPNRLGVLGGDNAGYPNGRRLTDDVTDIALQAVAGGTPFTPDYNKAPNNTIGDNVNTNELPFGASFPYVNAPYDYTGYNK